MKALILAAGMASRLRPLTDHTPKCLLNVGGKKILERAIENIRDNMISEIIIVTGYLEHMIRSFIAERFPDLKVTFIHNMHYAATNNIYSLWLSAEATEDDDMLMMDSDIIFDSRIITKLINSGFQNCLALKRHELGYEEIKVRTDTRHRVLEIGKNVDPALAEGESIGIEIFNRRSLPALYEVLQKMVIAEGRVNIFYEEAFEKFISRGNEMHAVDCSEYYCTEIDTESDLDGAASYLSVNHGKIQ